ncbi:transposase [Actinacidiphila oryziradicis]|uniref:transposase n=1 Tax=Actinacidiphila oryziradicis TaxID=2571141 RepID=UPI0023F0BDEE|nr:transposase [Actinacidiphila oryziradicis]MCW2872799.1 Transposase [Actinacidiphila oryziradicis]
MAADPDSEIVTATRVTAGNQGDADAAVGLLTDVLSDLGEAGPAETGSTQEPDPEQEPDPAPGATAYGAACATCPLAAQCTSAAGGRTVTVSRHGERLARARANSADPAWQADYRASRPKVERKIAHLMRRRHGGRRARMRGREKIAADFSLLAAAVNIARLDPGHTPRGSPPPKSAPDRPRNGPRPSGDGPIRREPGGSEALGREPTTRKSPLNTSHLDEHWIPRLKSCRAVSG